MANRHMERCSLPIITGEMQIKTTTAYRLPLVRMAGDLGFLLGEVGTGGTKVSVLQDVGEEGRKGWGVPWVQGSVLHAKSSGGGW